MLTSVDEVTDPRGQITPEDDAVERGAIRQEDPFQTLDVPVRVTEDRLVESLSGVDVETRFGFEDDAGAMR
jgi:hypothetical protein